MATPPATPPPDTRLLRRLTRDYRQRGADALSTLSRWASVRRGEEKHIFPYQENADIMLNSSLFYEISVLRPFAEKILREGPDTVPEYDGAAHAQVPRQLHPHRARRGPAHVDPARIHRRQQFSILGAENFVRPFLLFYLCVFVQRHNCTNRAERTPSPSPREGRDGPRGKQNGNPRHRRRERLAGMKDKCEKYIQTT